METKLYVGEVTLACKEEIEKIRRRHRHETSSHAFTSLWLWQKQMGLTLYLKEDFFAVRSSLHGDNMWFFPCGNVEKKRTFLEEHLGEEDFGLCYLRKEDVAFLRAFYPDRFLVKKSEESTEYIYDRELYREMSGGRYANFRNKYNKFVRNHAVKTETISDANWSAALELVRKYSKNAHMQGCHCLRDDGVAAAAMPYWKDLELFGILVYVDGIPQSMAIGFPLTSDTMDGCIEEHNREIPGLSYFTQRAFCLSVPEQFRYINGEEDLGLEGLRIMKQNMSPVRKIELFEAFRKKDEGIEKKYEKRK